MNIWSRSCFISFYFLALYAFEERWHQLPAGPHHSHQWQLNVSHTNTIPISLSHDFCLSPLISFVVFAHAASVPGTPSPYWALMSVWYSALHHWSPIHALSPLQRTKRITQLVSIGGCACLVCACARAPCLYTVCVCARSVSRWMG